MARFQYHRPTSVAEAVRLLQRYEGEAKLLAGGQSLMPLINLRLARPSALVDLNRLVELAYIRDADGVVAIGALTRHAQVGRSETVRRRTPLLTEATALIGYPAIRARGTMGGSLAHADPAGEYPTIAIALEAELRVRGPAGERTISAEAFFQGPMTTALAPDEVLVEARFRAQEPGEGWAYLELAPRPGDYAIVGVAARLRLGADGRVAMARLAYTAVGPTPIRAVQAEEVLRGQPVSESLFDLAGAMASEEVQPERDAMFSADYKRAMTRVFTRRALQVAAQRARGGA